MNYSPVNQPLPTPPASPSKTPKAVPFIIGGTLLALVVLAVGGFFLYQNQQLKQPDKLYDHSLSRTGIALGQLTDAEALDRISHNQIRGKLDLKLRQKTASAAEEACSLGSSQHYTVDIEAASAGGLEGETNIAYTEDGSVLLELDIKAITGANDVLPDVYWYFNPDTPCAQVVDEALGSALASFSSDLFADPQQFTGIWWMIDLDNLYRSMGLDPNEILTDLEQDSALSQISQEDYYELLGALSEVLQKYIFTDQQADMVLTMEAVLAENVDFKGTNTHKYEVKIDYKNFHRYVKESLQVIEDSQVYSKLAEADSTLEDSFTEVKEEILTELPSSGQTDDETGIIIWVDTDSRLIRNMRFFDKNDLAAGLQEPPEAGQVEYLDFGFVLADETLKIELGLRLKQSDDSMMSGNFALTAGINNDRLSYMISFLNQDVEAQFDLEVVGKTEAYEVVAPKNYIEIDFAEGVLRRHPESQTE